MGLMSRHLKQEVFWSTNVRPSVRPSAVVETLPHPPVGFSFRPCERLKENSSLKSFKAEVRESGRKKTGADSKETLCFGDWLCQKGFLLEDSEGLLGG